LRGLTDLSRARAIGVWVASLAMLCGCAGGRASSAGGRLPPEVASAFRQAQSGERGAPHLLGPGELKMLHPPTPLRGANGLACHDHRLFAAEALFDRISEVRPDGTTLPLSVVSDLRGPDDLLFDAAGNMYVTAAAAGEVWRRNPSGEWRRIASGLPGVNAIALDDDHGRLFVSECFSGDGLFEIALDESHPPRVIAKDVGGPNSMALLPDGALVAPLFFSGKVARFDVESGRHAVLASGLRAPTAAKVAPDGSLLVLEGATGAIRSLPAPAGVTPAATDSGTVFAQLPPGLDNLVFCDSSLLVSSFLTGAIYSFKPWNGGASRVLVPGGLAVPSGIALEGDDVLVADGIGLKRIVRGAARVEVATVIDQLPPPLGLALGGEGAAYVTAPFVGGVFRVDLHTRSVTRVASDLEWPTSVLALPGGALVVVETGAGRIVRIEPGGARRVLASGLTTPVGLAQRGISYLTAEPSSGHVLSIREGIAPTLVASNLDEPTGIAVDAAGRVYVAESASGRIVRIESDGARVPLVDGLKLARQYGIYPAPVPLAASQKGVVVGSPGDGSVLSIEAP
jgi:sugar lactone lactonase YvrE